RPRFGLMRGREFTMKDAYSFDRDVDGLKHSYKIMFDAYVRIFSRFGLQFRAVAADNGAIGGAGSHEFHVLADTGEDALAYCPDSDYAANVEAAQAMCLIAERAAPTQMLSKTPTPGMAKCETVAAMLGLPLERTVKSLVLAVDTVPGGVAQIWLLLLRGDHDLNEIKAAKVPGLANFRFANEVEIVECFGTRPGYLGPIGLKKPVQIVVDTTVANMSDFVCGANQEDRHYTGVNWERDLPLPMVYDLRNVVAGDPSPDGKGVLAMLRGIEVGHVFQLGTRYSQDMKATYLDENGKPQLLQMGCYGIGITRILGAAIEQNFDARGIIWPASIAPFEMVLCPIAYDRSDAVKAETDRLYSALLDAGVDVIVDDRGERPGAMLADWELIGVPHRIVIGERSLKEGQAEYQGRRDVAASAVKLDEVVSFILEKLR
ncbi:MAG: proline--tRNA ligase, partial [Herbaspirillum sp.]